MTNMYALHKDFQPYSFIFLGPRNSMLMDKTLVSSSSCLFIIDLSFLSSVRHASKYLANGTDRIGNVYKKAVYIEYTDQTFTTEKPKDKWLGFLGPVIHAEVGDEIVVHMKNFAIRNYSIHPHGVLYKKDSEGRMGFIVLLSFTLNWLYVTRV